MGYESRIIFIEGPWRDDDGEFVTVHPEHTYSDGRTVPSHVYGTVICDIDLSKVGQDGNVAKLIQSAIAAEKERVFEPDAVHYGFYEDGDNFLTHDRYGDPIAPMDVEELRQAVEADNRTAREQGVSPYRRFTLLEPICRELVTVPRWGPRPGVTALHYGY